MISISGYPTEDYKSKAQNVRPLGLGIMGLADMLCLMNIPYDSVDAYELCEEITKTLTHTAILASINLGKEYGSFPDFEENKEAMIKLCNKFDVDSELVTHLRNCNWTTIAPTGSTSISCDCSPGMEPLFGITYTKNIADSDVKWTFVNPIFERLYSEKSWYKNAVSEISKNNGSCQGIECVPLEVSRVWRTAHDIHWKERIEMQAYLQRGISNAISSTINLPKSSTVEDIRNIYMEAWKKGLKGITFYRDGSLDDQPVEFEKEEEKKIPAILKEEYERPRILNGKSYLVVTGHGKIYFTINTNEDGEVVEVFTNGGKGGGVSAASLEAIARLTSLSLQNGVSIEAIAHSLLGISDGRIVWDRLDDTDAKAVRINSIPDAVAQVLYRFYVSEEKIIPIEAICKEKKAIELTCPDCGGYASMKEGCMYCPSCGSMCG
jgi:ribonucleoside-diphosphate reductase alpha chain